MDGNFCIICLATDLRVFAFSKSEPKQFLENIFIEHGYVQALVESPYICYQCKALLEKTFQFVQKALKAQKILHETCNESSEITLDRIKAINRQEFGLGGNLSIDKIKVFIPSQDTSHLPKIKHLKNKHKDYECKENEPVENNSLEYENIENRPEGLIDEFLEEECKPEFNIFEVEDPLDTVQTNAGSELDKIPLQNEQSASATEATSNIQLKVHSTVPALTIDNSINYNHVLPSDKCNNAARTPQDLATNYKEMRIALEKRLAQIKSLKKKRKSKFINKKNIEEAPQASETDKVKTKTPHYAPSEFMLSLASLNETKRQRNKTKYVYSDDSDNSVSRKAKKSVLENEKRDSEFEPEFSSDSDDSAYDQYDDKGRLVKNPDGRVFPITCDDCETEISSRKQHFHHYLRDHPNLEYPYHQRKELNLLCQFCGHVSHNKYNQRAHEETHSLIAEHLCHECPKKFKNALRLKRHLRSTHNKTLLECDYCGKKFQTRVDIIRHLRIHTGEKPYKCYICGYGFAHKGNIRIHIRYKHQGEPFVFNKIKKNKEKKTSNCSPVEEESEDEPLIKIKKGGKAMKNKPNKVKAKVKK